VADDSNDTGSRACRIHLVDGTYELFRAYFGAPKALSRDAAEVGATRGIMRSLLALLRESGVDDAHMPEALARTQAAIDAFRRSALVASWRTGRKVLYRRTSLGTSIVQASDPAKTVGTTHA